MSESKQYEYKLSVVVLVYNTEYYLEDCLDSLVNQTLDNIEIICVNDESTDNSLNILKQYARKYDNIKIIDQKNAGGANAGNRGLKVAKGEYVTLVDSDDIVVEDAYEKMYNKAKETDSDVVCGKPNIYITGIQREVSHKHNPWYREQSINPEEFLDIFHDAYYWNKIYRREFVEKNGIYMIPGKIYADVPLVFRAYLFANKVTIIPDVVYYWRKRDQEAIEQGDSATSVSKSLLDTNNMYDRLITYHYLKDYFIEARKEYLFNSAVKLYFERLFYPIKGILKDEQFKQAYLNEMIPILNDIDNVYDNDLPIEYNLYIYFLLNNQIDALEEFMNFHKFDSSTVVRDGTYYWDLKYFENPEYDIPKELFKINSLNDKFIRIDNIKTGKKFINIGPIHVHANVNITNAYVVLMGLTKKGASRNDNSYEFKLEELDKNYFNAKIPINEINNLNIFDAYLKFDYDGKTEFFRIKERNFDKINKDDLTDNKFTIPFFSKLGNLSILNGKVKNIFKIKTDDEKMTIIQNTNGDINYKLSIDFIRANERVYFTKRKEIKNPNSLELEWKYSLDKNIPYTIYLNMRKHRFKLTEDYFEDFKDETINYKNNKILIFKDSDNSISLKMK